MFFDSLAISDVQREKMNFLSTIVSAQLDARDDANAKRLCSELCFLEAGECVVIRERNRSESCITRGSNDGGWRKRAVRCRRVHVEIDLAGLALRLPGCHHFL
jgi:hypothetical protein